jgi:hypothetical protein
VKGGIAECFFETFHGTRLMFQGSLRRSFQHPARIPACCAARLNSSQSRAPTWYLRSLLGLRNGDAFGWLFCLASDPGLPLDTRDKFPIFDSGKLPLLPS